MLAASLDILGPGHTWRVGTSAQGLTEADLVADAEQQTAWYRTAEYLAARPGSRVHISAIYQYCDTCYGTGTISARRRRQRCPTCKGRHAETVLYQDPLRIHWES